MPHKPLNIEETRVEEYESTFEHKPKVPTKQAQITMDALKATIQTQQMITEAHAELDVKFPKQDTGIVKQDNNEAIIVTEDVSHDKEEPFVGDHPKEQIALKNVDGIVLAEKVETTVEETVKRFEDEKPLFDQSKIIDVTNEQRVVTQHETTLSETTVPVQSEKPDTEVAKPLMSDLNFAPQVKETVPNEFESIFGQKAHETEQKAKTLQGTYESIQINETLTDEHASSLIVSQSDKKSGTITIDETLKTPTQMSTETIDAVDVLIDIKAVEEIGQMTQETKQAIIVGETIIGTKEADLFVDTKPAKEHTVEGQITHLIAPEQSQIMTQDAHGEFLEEKPLIEHMIQVQSDTKHKQTGQVMEHVLGESIGDEVSLEFQTHTAKPEIGSLQAATVSETIIDTSLDRLKSDVFKDVQAKVVQSSIEGIQVREEILHESEEKLSHEKPKEQQALHIFDTLKSSEVIETIPIDSTMKTKVPDNNIAKETVKQSHIPHEAFTIQETIVQETEVSEDKPKTREHQANITFTENIAAEQRETLSQTIAEDLSTPFTSTTQAKTRATIQEKHAPITTQIVPDDKHESFAPNELPIKSESAKTSISDIASSIPIITETLLSEDLGTHTDIPSHVIDLATETIVDTALRHTVKQSSVEISEVEEETVIKPKKSGKRER